MTKPSAQIFTKSHNIVASLSVLAMIAGLLASIYYHNSSWFILGCFLMLAGLLWALLDPFLHGVWFKFARLGFAAAIRWLANPKALKRNAVTLVYIVIPLLLRAFLLLPFILLGPRFFKPRSKKLMKWLRFARRDNKLRLARWNLL